MADDPAPIQTVWIQFKQHLKLQYNKAHIQLNNYFAHSLPRSKELYTDAAQTPFKANFVDMIGNQSIKVVTGDVCTTMGVHLDLVQIKVKQQLAILTWHHGMDNTSYLQNQRY